MSQAPSTPVDWWSQVKAPIEGQINQQHRLADFASDWDLASRTWGLDRALGSGMTQAGPMFAQSQALREQLAGQIGLVGASQTAQSRYANQDYATGLSRIGLQEDALSVDRGALARQSPLNDTLHRLAGELLGVQRLSANQQADISKRGALSSAVTRGAVTSPGLRQDNRDIENSLANQLTGYDITEREQTVRYNEQRASLADQNKMLDLRARDLGLSRDALRTELDRGLDRLGLSSQLQISDLTAKLNSSSIEDQVLAQQIFNAALQNSDYYAQYYPGPTPKPSTPKITGSASAVARRLS